MSQKISQIFHILPIFGSASQVFFFFKECPSIIIWCFSHETQETGFSFSLFLLFKYLLIWKVEMGAEVGRESPCTCSFPKWLQHSVGPGWNGEVRHQEFHTGYPISGRNSSIQAIMCCIPRHVNRKLGWKWNNQDLNKHFSCSLTCFATMPYPRMWGFGRNITKMMCCFWHVSRVYTVSVTEGYLY